MFAESGEVVKDSACRNKLHTVGMSGGNRTGGGNKGQTKFKCSDTSCLAWSCYMWGPLPLATPIDNVGAPRGRVPTNGNKGQTPTRTIAHLQHCRREGEGGVTLRRAHGSSACLVCMPVWLVWCASDLCFHHLKGLKFLAAMGSCH